MDYEEDELERMRARREQRRSRAQKEKGSAGKQINTNTETRKSSHKKGSRKADPKVKKNKRKILIAEILILFFLIIAAIGCYFYQKTFGSLQKIEFDEADVINIDLSDEQLEVMKGYWNVACFGVDSRMVNGKLNVGKGTNADVNLIASINMETGEIKLVSVFRDTYLNVNDKNSYNKLNYAYAQGGPEQAVKALNKNLGLNITQYATFNWKSVAEAINILGGVDIQLSENEFSWINAFITETVNETGIGSHQLTHAGDVHLDGVQAVAYGRLRLGDTDYARTERQRIILQKAFEKAKKADWATLNCIIETIMPQLATNISLTDLIPLARNITSYHIGETAGFPSARGEMSVGKLGDCVIPQTLEFNVRELHKFLFGEEEYQVPSNVKTYSDYIASVTGMTTEGTVIGHVRVDQGVSANSYIKRKQEKAAEAAAATTAAEETKETKTTESETDEDGNSVVTPETDENGDPIKEVLDPEEDEIWDDDWNEEWYDDDWSGVDENNGPGSNTSVPGVTSDKTNNSNTTSSSDKTNNSDKTNSSDKTNNSDKTNTSDKTNNSASTTEGPGASDSTSSSKESEGVITKPGVLTDPSGSSVKPGGTSETSGSSTTAPGSAVIVPGTVAASENSQAGPGGTNS